MTLEDQVTYLKTNHLFDAARANYDEHLIYFEDTTSIIDVFDWAADKNYNWDLIDSEICYKYKIYSPEDVLEAYYPKQYYPEKHI